jgi:hypothetical protein
MRRIAAILLLVGATLTVWLRDSPPAENLAQTIRFDRLEIADDAGAPLRLGPFRMLGAWHLTSAHTWFYGFSALLVPAPDKLLALSDRHTAAWFPMPGRGAAQTVRIERVPRSRLTFRSLGDIEAAARDPSSGTIWLAFEFPNAIERHDADLAVNGAIAPRTMQRWPENRGPEAMTRLTDGRFVAIGEQRASMGDPTHPAALFAGDPIDTTKVLEFRFLGPRGFSPTAMAQLPDGRVLVLMRRMVWPLPLRFTGLIALADPAEITAGAVWQAKTIAKFDRRLPVDNMEGMAIEPRDDGSVRVWVISDSNRALTQRTLLWELALDPQDLPRRRVPPPANAP